MPRGIFGLRLLSDPGFRARVVVLLIVIVLAFRILQFLIFTTQIQWGYDFSFYWRAAAALVAGDPIYSPDQLAGPYAPQGQNGFLYPPPFAAAMIPFAATFPLDYRVAASMWAALGALLLIATVLVTARAEGLVERVRGSLGVGPWVLVAAAFVFPPVVGELVLGNVHLLLLGLFALAWHGVRSGTPRGERIAGIAVGVAGLVKVFPLLIVVWFLVSGRKRAATWAIVGAAAAAAITLPLTGIQPWLDYPTVLANLSAPSDPADTLAPTVWLAPVLGFTAARVLVTVTALALVAWAALRRPAPIAYAATVVASLLIAPAMYHHYLAILVLPFLLAAGSLHGRGIWLVAAYFLLWGGTQPALGDLAWVVNRGMPTLGVLVLFGALLAGSRPSSEPPRAGTEPGPAGTFG